MRRVNERWEQRWEIVTAAIDEMWKLPLDESERYMPDPKGVRVRSYPFPYVAALSVNNDLDSMKREPFEDWHGFVNGRRTTSYGEGLGLEIGDSAWAWGSPTSFPTIFPQHPQVKPYVESADIGRIVELGRLGWLDTMHSLSGFDSPVPPLRGLPAQPNPEHLRVTRDDVKYALDRLNSLGMKPSVYVNHSCSITNIASEWPWLQYADEPWHETYCLDLLKDFGFRFFWSDTAVDNDRHGFAKFGDFINYGSPHFLRMATGAFDWERWLMSRARDEAGGLVGAMVDLPEDDRARRAKLAGFFNRTFFKAKAADGSDFFVFKRFNGVDTPSSSNFAVQVTTSRLDALERGGGAVIIYNHFGSWSMIGRGRRNRSQGRVTAPPVLDEHAVACWREIADRHAAGKLFVSTTARLLDYLWMRERMKMSVEQGPEKWLVTLQGMDCDVLGWTPIGEPHLNGLAFLVPSTAPEVVVHIEGRPVPLRLTRTPDPAFKGYDALHLPWRALEWPER